MKHFTYPGFLSLILALSVVSCTKNYLPVPDEPSIIRDINLNSVSNILILDDGFLVTGVRNSKIFISKLDVNFNPVWEKDDYDWGTLKSSGGWGMGSGYHVDIRKIFSNNNGSLTCFCEKSEGGDVIYVSDFIVTLDRYGNQISVTELPDIYYIDVAKTRDYGYLLTSNKLIKLNSHYSKSWALDNLNSDSYGLRIIGTADKGFAITGSWYSRQVLLQKLDDRGNILWTRNSFNQEKFNDRGFDICQLPDKGFMIIGWTHEYRQQADINCLMIRTASSGDTLWSKRFGNESNDWLDSFLYASSSDIIMQGKVGFPNDPVQKTVLLRISLDGQITGRTETNLAEKIVYSNSGYLVRADKVNESTIRFSKELISNLFAE